MPDLTYFKDEEGAPRPRPICKTMPDIERVIALGKVDDVVDVFINSCEEGLQWAWLDDYLEWEIQVAEIEAWNEEFAGTLSHVHVERDYD